jgi:hypothetical protein
MKRAAANADTQDIHITQGPEDDNPNDLEFKLHDHLVLRFVSPNLAKNKNTTQPLHAAYTIPHPRVLPCLHCRSERGKTLMKNLDN